MITKKSTNGIIYCHFFFCNTGIIILAHYFTLLTAIMIPNYNSSGYIRLVFFWGEQFYDWVEQEF